MQFIVQNIHLIIIAILGGIAGCFIARGFAMASKDEKKAKIQGWLVYAVKLAEDKFGSSTGKIKLAYVYDMFMAKFPSVAKYFSFEDFCKLVDKALLELELITTKQNQPKNPT